MSLTSQLRYLLGSVGIGIDGDCTEEKCNICENFPCDGKIWKNQINTLLSRFATLEDAVQSLYMAGYWRRTGYPEEVDRMYWEELRHAAEIPEGTATKAGVA